jgi:hypothetical protein
VVGLAGAASCLWVMSGLDLGTWVRLLVWLVIGLMIYFTYGRRHSRLQREHGTRFGPLRVDFLGLSLHFLALAGLVWSLYGLAPSLRGGGLLLQHGAGFLAEEGATSAHLLGALVCAVLAGYGLRLVLANKEAPPMEAAELETPELEAPEWP